MPKPRQREGAARRPAPKPEFSRPVDVSRIGRLEHRLAIAADAGERAALARRFGLLELAELAADLVLRKRGDGVIEAAGRWRARLAQPSVVSLEPVWSIHDAEARLYFSGALGGRRDAAAEPDPIDDADWPEPIVDGAIELGEAVVQLMAEALDPYPRLPGESADTA
jgi:hypothetical protein